MTKVKTLKAFRRGRDYLEEGKTYELGAVETQTLKKAGFVEIVKPPTPSKKTASKKAKK